MQKEEIDSDSRTELLAIINQLKNYLIHQKEMGLKRIPRSVGSPQTLQTVREELGDCHRCELAKARKNIVFGEGSEEASLVFVGEAPGVEEDLQGRPFVGNAGQLLTRIISAIGMAREAVYITNVVKCHPPNNRMPLPDETASCYPFLARQLQIIRPKVICALGNAAAQTLLETVAGITTLRGTFHIWEGIPVMPTFHPAYLLRNPERKKETWEDMKAIQDMLGMGI